MAKIRYIEIQNFRSIDKFYWAPSEGLNCLVGRGDSGKSTILDAIDYCLTARRYIQFSDADFHKLNTEKPIIIRISLGELEDKLLSYEKYGMYLRGFNYQKKQIEDEPGNNLEPILTVQLSVTDDLEPIWSLYSERGANNCFMLSWKERLSLSPLNLGLTVNHHFGWQKGSILHKFCTVEMETSKALLLLSRNLRKEFQELELEEFNSVNASVLEICKKYGIEIGEKAQSLLNPNTVNIGQNMIALHDGNNIPLELLGTGSSRLLLAGLYHQSSSPKSIVIADEIETGLEPHRILNVLYCLGLNDDKSQSFITTHSPIVLCELGTNHLFFIQKTNESHQIKSIPLELQHIVRKNPYVFLSKSVIVCEGKSEVGLLRGLDAYRRSKNLPSLFALGCTLISGDGSDQCLKYGVELDSLGIPNLIYRDNDVPITNKTYKNLNVVTYSEKRCTEEELFLSLPRNASYQLIKYAMELLGEDIIKDKLRELNDNSLNDLKNWELLSEDDIHRIATISSKKNPWFKNIERMEYIGKYILAPALDSIPTSDFYRLYNKIYQWAEEQ